MAYNLATTELSTIFLTADDPLNQESMNPKFQLLRMNDIVVNELFANSIGIWECKWYYDSSIRGYSIGDAVWLNTEDPDTFVKAHAGAIKHYTNLNSQILNKLPDFDQKDDSVIQQYKDAMSGYTDPDLGKDVVLPPIFDIGDFSKPIQLLISLKNNNKALLNDSTAWRKLFVDSDEDEENIRHTIDETERLVLEQHLKDYHLSGHESEAIAILSNYLDAPTDPSTVAYSAVPASWRSHYGDYTHGPAYGVDYVKFSIRKPYVLSGQVSQYQGVRYWNSGLMEQFGTIATDNPMFLSTDSDGNYMLKVPFNWKIANDESGAKAYERGELGNTLTSILSALETATKLVPPKDDLINVVYEKPNVTIDGSQYAKGFKAGDYNISLHPVYQTQGGLTDNYIPVAYGGDKLTQNWNSNYLTEEVLNRKDKNFFTMRLDTRVVPPYISYYAVGRGNY